MRPLKCAMLKINLFLSELFSSGDDRCRGVYPSTTHPSAHPVPVPISNATGTIGPPPAKANRPRETNREMGNVILTRNIMCIDPTHFR